MRYDNKEDKIRAYAHAIRGLLELEGDPEKRIKYLDFIDIYAALEEAEIEQYKREYPTEAQENDPDPPITSHSSRIKPPDRQAGKCGNIVTTIINNT